MPDLGQYAPFVLSAWGVVAAALSALTLFVVLESRQLKRRLAALEARRPGAGEAGAR